MTETEWPICADPGPILDTCGLSASVRKFRLFAVACCRRAEIVGPGPVARRGVEWAEQMTDGLSVGADLSRFLSDLLYEGFTPKEGHWLKKGCMARWHLALAVFNALQDGGRFRAGERRPELEGSIRDFHDELLHFALSQTLREGRPPRRAIRPVAR